MRLKTHIDNNFKKISIVDTSDHFYVKNIPAITENKNLKSRKLQSSICVFRTLTFFKVQNFEKGVEVLIF